MSSCVGPTWAMVPMRDTALSLRTPRRNGLCGLVSAGKSHSGHSSNVDFGKPCRMKSILPWKVSRAPHASCTRHDARRSLHGWIAAPPTYATRPRPGHRTAARKPVRVAAASPPQPLRPHSKRSGVTSSSSLLKSGRPSMTRREAANVRRAYSQEPSGSKFRANSMASCSTRPTTRSSGSTR